MNRNQRNICDVWQLSISRVCSWGDLIQFVFYCRVEVMPMCPHQSAGQDKILSENNCCPCSTILLPKPWESWRPILFGTVIVAGVVGTKLHATSYNIWLSGFRIFFFWTRNGIGKAKKRVDNNANVYLK